MKIGMLVEWDKRGCHRIGIITEITINKYGKKRFTVMTNDRKIFHPAESKLFLYH